MAIHARLDAFRCLARPWPPLDVLTKGNALFASSVPPRAGVQVKGYRRLRLFPRRPKAFSLFRRQRENGYSSRIRLALNRFLIAPAAGFAILWKLGFRRTQILFRALARIAANGLLERSQPQTSNDAWSRPVEMRVSLL